MYFKKLEIFGFKSFAEKTSLNFESGITAIVGPNGCGKSNVFDSIRWVLGEQSMKNLRGSVREDVIFNGTDKKSPLGFAEVSLCFSNETRAFPMDEKEVKITRRLFRSGESEYLLNDNLCRLKDIQDLLMGTGIGTDAYSMIQQGRVDQVVSSKPEDRRNIIDEAAGITKYKSQKKEALSKLQSTEDNLLRLNDIIIEVRRQIGSMERQANKARKYKEEFERLKDLEVGFAKHQIENYESQKAQLDQKLQELKDQETRLNQEMDQVSEQLTNDINYLAEIEQNLNGVNAEEIKLEGQIDLNNRQIGFNQERMDNLEQTNRKISEQKDQLIEKCRVQQEKVEEWKAQITVLEETMQYNVQTLKEKKDALALIEKEIKFAKDKIKEHEEKILLLTSQQVSIRNELTDVMKEMQGGLARKRRLELEQEKVLNEKQEVEQKMQNVEFQIKCFQSSLSELETDKSRMDLSLTELETQLATLQENINELEKQRLFLRSQKEFIEKLHMQYKDIPDPIVEGTFYTTQPPQEHHTGIIGKVKEFKVAQGPHMDFIKEKFGVAQAQELYEIICETKFIQLDPQQISEKIEEIGLKIDEYAAQRNQLSERIKGEESRREEVGQEILKKEKSLSIFLSQRDDIQEEMKKLNGEFELVELELIEIRESLGITKKKEDELNYRLDTISQDIVWAQNDIKAQQLIISDKSQEKEETTVAIAQIETELESDKDKMKSQKENLAMFSDSLDAWLEEIKGIDDEVANNQLKKAQYGLENEQLELKIGDIRQQKDSLRETFTRYEMEKEEQSRKINSAKTHVNALEEEIDKIKADGHLEAMNAQQLNFTEKGIKDRLLQTYKIDYDEYRKQKLEALQAAAAAGDQSAAQEEPFIVEQVQEELDKLRKKCEAYGHVNLAAMDEYDELKGRFEFLTKQQADLLEAKSQLLETIRKINRQTRQMFMDTFTKVSEEFRIYFRMLFGGGEAQLVLLDEENVLESGIDIIARPPGKKLQNMNLLSGGEKTLTAIALIFGVFKVNPSPFCVLDEIDAALDEANVGRFSYLLKDFSKIAQFIVITHNKKTIASADVLYGVTMPETGVSRIVSVKFSEDDKKVKEAVAVAA